MVNIELKELKEFFLKKICQLFVKYSTRVLEFTVPPTSETLHCPVCFLLAARATLISDRSGPDSVFYCATPLQKLVWR